MRAGNDPDHATGRSDDELRALVAEADASGPAVPWDAAAVKAEVLRRHAARRREQVFKPGSLASSERCPHAPSGPPWDASA